MGLHLDLSDVAAGHPMAEMELVELRISADRYETARRMNPRQWADAWELNITTGKPFDEIIDDLRPFIRPNVEFSGTAKRSFDGSAGTKG